MIKTIQILIVILIGRSICYSQENLLFESENLTFNIQDSVFFVEGLYYFNSAIENEYPIFYPFPTDSVYSKPFNIHVEYINTSQEINYNIASDSSSIVFSVLIKGETPLLITYNQYLKANKAKYILNTTKYWGRPLKQVDFKLVTALDVVIKSFSITPDKKFTLENKKIYLWQKENYMPKKDFEIEF